MERLKRLRENEQGQSTVELALALPVMMIAAIVAYNALMFFGSCATFDRVFRDAVRVYASTGESLASASANARIASAVQSQMDGQCVVRVSSGVGPAGTTRYTATLTYTPTVFGRALQGSVFGVKLAAPCHTCTLTIDTFATG
ncbi:MAG: hypothetical protein IKF96_01585 [Eggerthellaceae bacterium]|nr:hypothetical protein [Eggerthellaceae bacterium]